MGLRNKKEGTFRARLAKVWPVLKAVQQDDCVRGVATEFIAKGMGLYVGYEGRPARFNVYHIEGGNPSGVRVELWSKTRGPMGVDRRTSGDRMEVVYVPPSPGRYKILLTWKGRPLPGSPFDVKVEDASMAPCFRFPKSQPQLSNRPTVSVIDFGNEKMTLDENGKLVPYVPRNKAKCFVDSKLKPIVESSSLTNSPINNSNPNHNDLQTIPEFCNRSLDNPVSKPSLITPNQIKSQQICFNRTHGEHIIPVTPKMTEINKDITTKLSRYDVSYNELTQESCSKPQNYVRQTPSRKSNLQFRVCNYPIKHRNSIEHIKCSRNIKSLITKFETVHQEDFDSKVKQPTRNQDEAKQMKKTHLDQEKPYQTQTVLKEVVFKSRPVSRTQSLNINRVPSVSLDGINGVTPSHKFADLFKLNFSNRPFRSTSLNYKSSRDDRHSSNRSDSSIAVSRIREKYDNLKNRFNEEAANLMCGTKKPQRMEKKDMQLEKIMLPKRDKTKHSSFKDKRFYSPPVSYSTASQLVSENMKTQLLSENLKKPQVETASKKDEINLKNNYIHQQNKIFQPVTTNTHFHYLSPLSEIDVIAAPDTVLNNTECNYFQINDSLTSQGPKSLNLALSSKTGYDSDSLDCTNDDINSEEMLEDITEPNLSFNLSLSSSEDLSLEQDISLPPEFLKDNFKDDFTCWPSMIVFGPKSVDSDVPNEREIKFSEIDYSSNIWGDLCRDSPDAKAPKNNLSNLTNRSNLDQCFPVFKSSSFRRKEVPESKIQNEYISDTIPKSFPTSQPIKKQNINNKKTNVALEEVNSKISGRSTNSLDEKKLLYCQYNKFYSKTSLKRKPHGSLNIKEHTKVNRKTTKLKFIKENVTKLSKDSQTSKKIAKQSLYQTIHEIKPDPSNLNFVGKMKNYWSNINHSSTKGNQISNDNEPFPIGIVAKSKDRYEQMSKNVSKMFKSNFQSSANDLFTKSTADLNSQDLYVDEHFPWQKDSISKSESDLSVNKYSVNPWFDKEAPTFSNNNFYRLGSIRSSTKDVILSVDPKYKTMNHENGKLSKFGTLLNGEGVLASLRSLDGEVTSPYGDSVGGFDKDYPHLPCKHRSQFKPRSPLGFI